MRGPRVRGSMGVRTLGCLRKEKKKAENTNRRQGKSRAFPESAGIAPKARAENLISKTGLSKFAPAFVYFGFLSSLLPPARAQKQRLRNFGSSVAPQWSPRRPFCAGLIRLTRNVPGFSAWLPRVLPDICLIIKAVVSNTVAESQREDGETPRPGLVTKHLGERSGVHLPGPRAWGR